MRITTLIFISICLTAHAQYFPTNRIPYNTNTPGAHWFPGVPGDLNGMTNATIFTNINGLDATGATDVAPTLNAILLSASALYPPMQRCVLSNGTYGVAHKVVIPSGVVLSGSDMTNTIIKTMSSMVDQWPIFMGNPNFNSSGDGNLFQHYTTFNIYGDLLQTATNLSTTTAHGWSAGDYVLIDRLPDNTNTVLTYSGNDPPVYDQMPGYNLITWGSGHAVLAVNSNRICAQWVHILSVSQATNATFDPPALVNFSNVYTPQATKAFYISTNVGLESLTVDNSNGQGSSGPGYQGTELDGLINSFIWNVQFTEIQGPENFLKIRQGLYGTVRHCFFRMTGAVTGNSQGYGVYSVQPHTGWLFEDNIFCRCELAFGIEGGVMGDVYSYNYVTNLIYADQQFGNNPGSTQRQFGPAHGGNNQMNLLEGNFLNDGGFDADNYQGTHARLTAFRNKFQTRTNSFSTSWTNPIYGNVVVDNWGKNWKMNFVANILGYPGFETRYRVIPDADYSGEMDNPGNPPSVWRMGYFNAAINGSAIANYVFGEAWTNAIKHGNWDSAVNGIVYDATIADHTFPPSYYLGPTKPAWFGDCVSYPAMDPSNGAGINAGNPDNVTRTNNNAWYRFTYNADPPISGGAASVQSAQVSSASVSTSTISK